MRNGKGAKSFRNYFVMWSLTRKIYGFGSHGRWFKSRLRNRYFCNFHSPLYSSSYFRCSNLGCSSL